MNLSRLLDEFVYLGFIGQWTPAQVSRAWMTAQPGVAAPIASATTVEQLRDIAKAAYLNLDKGTLKNCVQ